MTICASNSPSSPGLLLLLVWANLSNFGCSALPDYAAPRGNMVSDPSRIERGDLIEYRALKRSDFKASEPPAEAREHAQKLGALTCTFITTTPQTGYQVREVRGSNGDSTFVGQFKEIGFVAYMDRACSWWNPAPTSVPQAYVLQHEQVHFALSEIEARRRHHTAQKKREEFRVTTSSLQEAKEQLSEDLKAFVADAMEDLLEVNQQFDEDTSAVYDPAAQQAWWERVERQLAEVR
jgi:hypothetical protein